MAQHREYPNKDLFDIWHLSLFQYIVRGPSDRFILSPVYFSSP